MKRFLLFMTALALCAGVLIYTLPVEAGKNYNNNSLYGIWYYVATEIRHDGTHCNNYGTIEFYNDAGQDVAETDERYRCVLGTTVDDCDPSGPPPCTHQTSFTYDVDSDGHFTMTAQPSGHVTHCKILNNGKLVLCDGTDALDPNPTDQGAISYFAVAVKE